MNFKTLTRGLTCTAAALSFSASAAPVSLSLGHVLNTDSHYQAAGQHLAQLLKERSNGEITLNLFPQSQLGGEVKMIQAARAGALDMFVTSSAAMVNTIPEYQVFDTPYLFDSVDQGNAVLGGTVGQRFMDMLPKYNLMGLGFLSVMERNVFSSRPVRSAGDMKGMKLRVVQSPGYVKAYEALGSQPTPMAYSEVYLSLQQGVVDGAETSPDQFVMDKFVEVSKFYNKTRVNYQPAMVIMSKARFDKLSPEHQKILTESAAEAMAVGIEYYKKSYAESIEAMQKAGVEVVDPDMDSLMARTESVRSETLKGIPNGAALFQEIDDAKKAL